MPATTSRFTMAAASLGAVALLAGCAGGSTHPAAEQTDVPIEKVTVGLIGASAAQMPMYAAIEEGFLKDRDLEVDIVSFAGGGSQSITALASGDVDMLITGAPSFISAVGSGALEARLFYQFAANAFDIVGKTSMTSLDDVIGEPVAVSGIASQDQIWFEYAVEKAGYNPSDFSYAVSGGVSDRIAGLVNGGFAAAALPAPFRAQYEGQTNTLINGDEAGNVLPAIMIGAMGAYLDENEARVQSFVDALGEGAAWSRDAANRDTAVEYCVEYTEAPVATCGATFDSFVASPTDGTYSATGAIEVEGTSAIIEIASRLNEFENAVEIDQVVDFRFTD